MLNGVGKLHAGRRTLTWVWVFPPPPRHRHGTPGAAALLRGSRFLAPDREAFQSASVIKISSLPSLPLLTTGVEFRGPDQIREGERERLRATSISFRCTGSRAAAGLAADAWGGVWVEDTVQVQVQGKGREGVSRSHAEALSLSCLALRTGIERRGSAQRWDRDTMMIVM